MMLVVPRNSKRAPFLGSYDKHELASKYPAAWKQEVILHGNAYLPRLGSKDVHIRMLFLDGKEQQDSKTTPVNERVEFMRRHHAAFDKLREAVGEAVVVRGDIGFMLLEGFGVWTQGEPPLPKVAALDLGRVDGTAIVASLLPHEQQMTAVDVFAFIKGWLKKGNLVAHESTSMIQMILQMNGSVRLGDHPVNFSVNGGAGSSSSHIEPVNVDKRSCFSCGEPISSSQRTPCDVCSAVAFCKGCGLRPHGCVGHIVSSSRTTNLGNFRSPPTCSAAGCCKEGSGEAPLLCCSRCKVAKYCDRNCQVASWKEHKKQCQIKNPI